jgi:hypothetical protein
MRGDRILPIGRQTPDDRIVLIGAVFMVRGGAGRQYAYEKDESKNEQQELHG